MEEIKQLLPIPERLTAMIKIMDDKGRECFVDAAAEGWSVLYALMGDNNGGEIAICVIDPEGSWSIDSCGGVYFVPTLHCPRCGQQMIARVNYCGDRSRQLYECTCGEVFDREKLIAIAETLPD